jgi:hypothetical protein
MANGNCRAFDHRVTGQKGIVDFIQGGTAFPGCPVEPQDPLHNVNPTFHTSHSISESILPYLFVMI